LSYFCNHKNVIKSGVKIHYFEGGTKLKIHSEIKPPLTVN